MQNFWRSKTKVTLLFLVLLGALVFLPLVSKLGYYRDDWHVAWAGYTRGPQQIFDQHLTDRPFMGLLYAGTYMLLGDRPISWHLYSVGMKIVGAAIFYWMGTLIWPRRQYLAGVSAALFLVFPGFLQLPTASAYSNHMVGLNMGLLSLALSLKLPGIPEQRKGLRVLMTLVAMASALVCYLIMEWMIGLELARGALLLAFGQVDTRSWRQRLKIALARWLPNILAFGAFLVWRVFFFESARSVIDVGALGQSYLAQPAAMIPRLFAETLQDLFETLILSWSVPLYNTTHAVEPVQFFVSLAFGLVAGGLSLVYVRRLHYKNPDSAFFPQTQRREMQLVLLVGLAWVLFTITPVVLANRSVEFENTFDRYTLAAAPGVVLAWVAAVSLVMDARANRILFVGMVVISAMTHYNNAVFFQRFWETQRQVWWQLAWRAPDFEDHTVLTALLPKEYRLAESYEIWGPANIIYRPDGGELKLTGEVLNQDTLLPMLSGDSFGRTFRRIPMTIDFSNLVVMSLPGEGACLHVFDGSYPEVSDREDAWIHEIADVSRVDMIRTEESGKLPPLQIFGPEPAHNWCYFYQKASLARQKGDWQEVARLGDEARARGLQPVDLVEWMPFYFSYSKLGRYDDANQISADLRLNQNLIESLCAEYERHDPPDGYSIRNLCEAN